MGVSAYHTCVGVGGSVANGLAMQTVLSTLARFGARTSIPGWSQAARSRSWQRALYWLAVFVAGVVITTHGLVKVRVISVRIV